MAIFCVPVVFVLNANDPMATLLNPLVIDWLVLKPTAMLLEPVVTDESAPDPIATLSKPLVNARAALNPTATLFVPVVSDESAPTTNAVLYVPVVTDERELPNAKLPGAAKSNVSVEPDPTNLGVAFAVTILILPAD